MERIKKRAINEDGTTDSNNLITTKMVRIKYKGNKRPPKLVIYGEVYNTRPLIYKVRRCTNCQKFGHVAQWCKSKNKPRCVICGGLHLSKDCSSEYVKCAKYQNIPEYDPNHKADDLFCPEFKKQKIIEKLMGIRDIPYQGAL